MVYGSALSAGVGVPGCQSIWGNFGMPALTRILTQRRCAEVGRPPGIDYSKKRWVRLTCLKSFRFRFSFRVRFRLRLRSRSSFRLSLFAHGSGVQRVL